MAENNELYDVIDSNIVPNGVKGITAQGLKNTLYAMADKIGNGGGGNNVGTGGLYIYFGIPVIGSDGEIAHTPEQKAHNAEVFKIIKESISIPTISIDSTDYWIYSIGIPDGVDTTGIKMSFISNQVQYITEELAALDGQTEMVIISGAIIGAFGLRPDGSIILLM